MSRSMDVRLALAGLSVACVGSCGVAHGPPAGKARRVILVTCDTLRADHLGTYGYARPTSPEVDRFARESVIFDEAYSTTTWTGPAVASLLTGRIPDELGLQGGNHFVLAPEAVTVSELARDAGYFTAAVVSNWVLRHPSPAVGDAGVQQGFQVYDDDMQILVKNRSSFERGAAATTDAALAWLEKRRQRGEDRFFLWVHYMDPHGPYLPPPEVLARFERPLTDEPPVPLGETLLGKGQVPAYQNLDGERRPEMYRMRYDAEIANFDAHFGRFLDGLKKSGWWQDSLIIFTADHGESLGEHDFWFCHGENVHREEARVPLVIRFPDGPAHIAGEKTPRGERVRDLVGLLDLWPTLLDGLGLEPRPNRGITLFAHALPPDRINLQSLGAIGTPRRWTSISDGSFRWIADGDRPARLFDIRSDPSELEDLSSKDPARAADLARRGREWLERGASPPLQALVDLSDERRRRAMRALGYVEGEDR